MSSAFRIVRSLGPSLTDLEREVNRVIEEGWIMHGTHVWVERSQEWTQAMVRVPLQNGSDLRLREQKRR